MNLSVYAVAFNEEKIMPSPHENSTLNAFSVCSIDPQYFECMYRLNNFFIKSANISGICHHMIFEKKILDEIFNLIKQPDEEVYETIIKAVTPSSSGFSEYELYFNYIFKKYPELYTIRHLNYDDVTDYKLFLQNNNYDYIANHAWKRL